MFPSLERSAPSIATVVRNCGPLRIHLRHTRCKDGVDPGCSQSPHIRLERTRVGAQIFVRAELSRIHEDRNNLQRINVGEMRHRNHHRTADDLCPVCGLTVCVFSFIDCSSECDMSRVQRAHGRHEAEGTASSQDIQLEGTDLGDRVKETRRGVLRRGGG